MKKCEVLRDGTLHVTHKDGAVSKVEVEEGDVVEVDQELFDVLSKPHGPNGKQKTAQLKEYVEKKEEPTGEVKKKGRR